MKKRLRNILLIVGLLLFSTLYIVGSLSYNFTITLTGIIGVLLIMTIFIINRFFSDGKNKKWYLIIIFIIALISYTYFSISDMFMRFESNQLSSEQSIVREKYWKENDEVIKEQYYIEERELESKIDNLRSRIGSYGLFQSISFCIIIILPSSKTKNNELNDNL